MTGLHGSSLEKYTEDLSLRRRENKLQGNVKIFSFSTVKQQVGV